MLTISVLMLDCSNYLVLFIVGVLKPFSFELWTRWELYTFFIGTLPFPLYLIPLYLIPLFFFYNMTTIGQLVMSFA